MTLFETGGGIGMTSELRIRIRLPKPKNYGIELLGFDKLALNNHDKEAVVLEEEEEEEDDDFEHSTPTIEDKVAIHTSSSSEEYSSSNEEAEGGGTREKQPFTCEECGKTFRSNKSLYGHLRCHPNRNYRGASRPSKASRPQTNNHSPPHEPFQPLPSWGLTAKRSHYDAVDPDVYNAAGKLIFLSKDFWTIKEQEPNQPEVRHPVADEAESPKEKPIVIHEASPSPSPSPSPAEKKKSYTCIHCSRSFSSHQALGGHMASHNKNRHTNNEGEAASLACSGEGGTNNASGGGARRGPVEHRCNECDETFATGQALGGHKRRHFHSTPAAGNAKRVKHCGIFELDLNELPMLEE